MEPVMVMGLIVAAIVVCFGLGGVGAWISGEKGRAAEEGFFLGLLLGPLGLVIAAVLPVKPR